MNDMDITRFQHETFNGPLRPGFWRWVNRDGNPIVKLACHLCGTEAELWHGHHFVDDNGKVTPSVVCPDVTCDMHVQPTLEDYKAP